MFSMIITLTPVLSKLAIGDVGLIGNFIVAHTPAVNPEGRKTIGAVGSYCLSCLLVILTLLTFL